MTDLDRHVDTVASPMATDERSPTPSTALGVEHVRRDIGGRSIVDDVSFEVADGELFVLVGPSGCGKSSLLRLVAGLDPTAAGRVVLAGRDVTGLAPEKRRIGLVFQDHALFPHRRIDQNIAFGLGRLDRRERDRRVAELLDLVRLPGMAKRYPHELSGGEQQRIALARALAPDPALVLLDEPFASLDPSLRDEVRTDVVAALRERGAAAVLVTHERDEALALGDRIAVMSAGRILQIDRPDEVYEHPVDRFVAEFLGEAAFVPADDGRLAMVRPHDLAVTPGGADEIVDRRYLGAVWRYDVRRSDGAVVVVDVVAGPGDRSMRIGDRVTVTVAADHPLHLLPA